MARDVRAALDPLMAPASPLRVAVLGAGTVGGAVVRVFLDRPELLVTHDGAPVELVAVAVRDVERARLASIPVALLTDAPAHLVADDGVDVVVELMGGDEPAHTLVAAALGAGKAVVTANKHMLAHHGAALEATARRSGAALRFEASVGGGIPLLSPIAEDLAANRVSGLRGIVNGTTNFILNDMASRGRDYGEVLADAQAAGYAEADPTADVEGFDAANKLVILMRLAFGFWADPADIARTPLSLAGRPRAGITGVGSDELAGAAALGLAIKLIASATRLEDGTIFASVLPTALPLTDPMSRVEGVTNRIEVRAEPIGSLAFSGPGAGGPATASAVLGDLMALARRAGSTWAGLPPAVAPPAIAGPIYESPDRGWYAFAPGVRREVAADERVRTAIASGGTAIHARCLSLAELRALLSPLMPDELEAPIYTTDESPAVPTGGELRPGEDAGGPAGRSPAAGPR